MFWERLCTQFIHYQDIFSEKNFQKNTPGVVSNNLSTCQAPSDQQEHQSLTRIHSKFDFVKKLRCDCWNSGITGFSIFQASRATWWMVWHISDDSEHGPIISCRSGAGPIISRICKVGFMISRTLQIAKLFSRILWRSEGCGEYLRWVWAWSNHFPAF